MSKSKIALSLAMLLLAGTETQAARTICGKNALTAANGDSTSNIIQCDVNNRPEFCTDDYTPVCAHITDCTEGPCTKTISNACNACADPTIDSYVAGECPEDQVMTIQPVAEAEQVEEEDPIFTILPVDEDDQVFTILPVGEPELVEKAATEGNGEEDGVMTIMPVGEPEIVEDDQVFTILPVDEPVPRDEDDQVFTILPIEEPELDEKAAAEVNAEEEDGVMTIMPVGEAVPLNEDDQIFTILPVAERVPVEDDQVFTILPVEEPELIEKAAAETNAEEDGVMTIMPVGEPEFIEDDQIFTILPVDEPVAVSEEDPVFTILPVEEDQVFTILPVEEPVPVEEKTVCDPNNRPEFCTDDWNPVCAHISDCSGDNCFQTASNACEGCAIVTADYHVPGECSNSL